MLNFIYRVGYTRFKIYQRLFPLHFLPPVFVYTLSVHGFQFSKKGVCMSVITIRGQMGSGAAEIGSRLAEELHIGYVDREIIAQVARRLKLTREEIAEKEMPPSSILARLAEILTSTYPIHPGIPDIGLPVWDIPLNDISYLAGLEYVIKELARNRSIVIRGRGSQFILRDYPCAFHVLVVAPLEVRISRVMQELTLDEDAARKEIKRVDDSRREFIKRYFKADLEDPSNYDLVVNTRRIGFDGAAALIAQAVQFGNR
jgi:cytidylate kinase